MKYKKKVSGLILTIFVVLFLFGCSDEVKDQEQCDQCKSGIISKCVSDQQQRLMNATNSTGNESTVNCEDFATGICSGECRSAILGFI